MPDSTALAWSWNARKQPVNPYAVDVPARKPSALAVWIALYEQDKSDQREQAEAMSRAAEEYLFSIAHCDPWRYDELNDALIEKAKRHAELHRVDPLTLIRDDVASLPGFLRKPLETRIKYLEKSEDPRHLPTYLNEVITPSLVRIDKVRANQASLSFQAMAGRDSLDQLLRLAELNQREVKRLSTLVAAHIDMIFIQLCGEILTDELASPIVILELYRRVAAEVSRLDVIPPGYEALRSKHNRRNPINYELIPGALARMRCADWWQRKLWQLRNEWREELLRAACLVHRHASPYVSHDILLQKREQRRKAMDFFRNHDLINEDGDTLSMEDVMLASASNPAHRRNEMMACVKGLELIAEMRGDCAMFYTITCPSKYHATLMNGKPNPTWDHSTVRKSSDYLVDTFAAFRKAMHKKELRWYGVRVAEPHHDGTVHWHLLCFMRKKHRRAITELLRRFAIREDRAELGNNTGARFKSKLIDPRKGTPASYIAKYVSKNIDGRGLGDTVSKETGKSLRDSAEYVTAWASLHRVQQFRFFGIPGRQAYRELRLFASQATRAMKTSKPGAPVLMDPKLDAVLAAADVGCFATYIMKQGGVLVPRKNYLIHTAYEPTVEPGTYGDHGIRVYGIWSPITGKENKICTHVHTWKMVKKTPANPGAESAAQGDPVAPWTRGNNCPQSSKGLEKVIVNDAEISEQLAHDEELGSLDVSSLPAKERNAVLRRLREACKVMALPANKPQLLNSSPRACSIRDFALSIGIELSESQIEHLMQGKRLRFYDRIFYATFDGELRSTEPENSDIPVSNVWRTITNKNKVEFAEIRRDPIRHYSDMLKRIDPSVCTIFFVKKKYQKA
ncbi:replication endonuclease [Klebsiella pneumoniae]|uniref:replication endonuclease n=1 Tax=Klebsiella pneumoniae complex TaxID=3390273 RepID=UPI000D7507EF|nr:MULTISPECIES: replication endonuclease [Klebsiella]ELA2853391.1 replication endonuclease [Klebsiella pneumoniae]MDR4570089.1 replication endonuclease [Klebsiella pneumoniae]MDR4616918.1 replication endonuclease [Klebsiella pneumoniae]MDR4718974.1 replication endonuclease [Klebsiella pneumoniae]MEB2900617.1 replication endonuclease [Klebsiella pneumoniae]